MSSTQVVLILGSGPGIGASVASCFAENGFKVASAARSLATQKKSDTHLDLQVDLSKPESIPAVFAKIEEEFGAPPSVVVYNGTNKQTSYSMDC